MTFAQLLRNLSLALALLVASSPRTASAQATGTITGFVTDSSNAAVPGGTVDVTNRGTGQVRSAVTTSQGVYTVPLLNPGTYEVRASLAGFRTSIHDNVSVVVNETARVDFQMQVGQIEERIDVQAEAPLVET